MSDHVTLRERVHRWRQRSRALRAWISFWRALTWRQRNGLWVCWSSLEDGQREIFKEQALAGIFDAWHAARGKRHILDPAASEMLDDAVPLGVHEALEAWQSGDITYRRAMRLVGGDTIADLYAAAHSSGVTIRRGLTDAEERLVDRATRLIALPMMNRRAAPMKRYDRKARAFVEAPDVDAFLAEIASICDRHGMSLGHEDRQGAFEVYRRLKPEAIRWLMGAHIEAFDNELSIWLDTLTVETRPSADELAAAPTINDWRWSPTDTAGLYVRGMVDGHDHTTGEVMEIDPARRWVRDRNDMLWLLTSEENAVARGSGDFLRDMGYGDPDGMREKFAIANEIALAIERLAIDRAANAAAITPDRMRQIADGRVKDVPLEELRRVLAALTGSERA